MFNLIRHKMSWKYPVYATVKPYLWILFRFGPAALEHS